MQLAEGTKRARQCGASLIAVTTADQQAAARTVAAIVNGGAGVLAWDPVRGPHSINGAAGQAVLDGMLDGMDPAMATDFAACALLAYDKMVEGSVLVVYQGHKLLDDARCVAAIMMLRDAFASRGATLMLLCPMWEPPAELATDVLLLDDALPDEDMRRQLAIRVTGEAKQAAPELQVNDDDIARAARLTRGLSPYAAEQTIALSIQRTGLDQAALESRFVAAINATKGLRIEPEPVLLSNIGGLAAAKERAKLIAGGRFAPDLVIILDEIEKALAGATGPVGDSSGVSQDMLGCLLTFMEEGGADGLIALGPPGAGKSFCAKALGALCGCPTLFWDMGAMKGSLVGSTEQATRAVLRTIKALADRPFFLATANALVSVPSALRRRFKAGVMFFDLPSREEKDMIWPLYFARYELGKYSSDVRPDDTGWSGAEIRNCCQIAWQYRISPVEAGNWIVPVSKSASEEIEALRRGASGRYLSASYPGVYRYEPNPDAPSGGAPQGRRFAL